ncbi:hypothetical protein IAD21_03649 [Abditibacteriota bacterium]|nr:hypothetical protein IAD21_03649 [Abditibacteriota bacterium]
MLPTAETLIVNLVANRGAVFLIIERADFLSACMFEQVRGLRAQITQPVKITLLSDSLYMFNSRRPLIWLPLAALTLFLVVCGWRSWHLPNDAESVWLVMADSFPMSMQRGAPTPSFPGQENLPDPFIAGQSVKVGIEDDPTQAINDKNFPFKPLPPMLLKEIQSHHQGIPIKNIKDHRPLTKNEWRILFPIGSIPRRLRRFVSLVLN